MDHRRSVLLRVLGVIILVLILAAVLIPGQIVSRLARNESSAAYSLRALTDLEIRYAAARPSKGFTCEFALLKTAVPSNGNHTHDGFLFSDSFDGYKFSLTGCETDPTGVVIRFKATAVPLSPGKTGVRAFCIDQTRELLYSVNGAAESCRPL
jgi:hypothetical protein